jgi:plasmid maintenance system antidote protein VapI
MADDKGPYPFNPDWTVAPGATLADWMREHQVSVPVLALRCGGQEGQAEAGGMIRDVLEQRPLTRAHAVLLAEGTGVSASFWVNYELNYRADLAVGRTDTTGDVMGRVPGA